MINFGNQKSIYPICEQIPEANGRKLLKRKSEAIEEKHRESDDGEIEQEREREREESVELS